MHMIAYFTSFYVVCISFEGN